MIRIGQDISVADPTEITALERDHETYLGLAQHKLPRVFHNLPQPDYINFVGRRDELNHLNKLLHPQDRVWTIVIDGVGGIGKSALALEIAHRYLSEFTRLPANERFEAIVWVSAKSTLLTADGIVPRQQVTRTIDDIFKAIAICLENDDIVRARAEDQSRLINRVLTRQRTLLIIDNLETIDDERVNSFIRELPTPTKCIVTTRHRIDIADPVRLTGMPRSDALVLIAQECAKKNVQVNEQQTDLLYKRTGGVPLAVVWSIAQMGYGHDANRVLHSLGNVTGDIAKFCFESAIAQIVDKDSYLLLVAICLSTYTNDRKYLAEITGLSDLDRDESLVDLERLSLINRQNDRFGILPLVKD